MSNKDFKTAAELLSTEKHDKRKNVVEAMEQPRKSHKKVMMIAAVIFLAFVGSAFAAKFVSITGYATVDKAVKIDIIGSSNDESYSLGTVYQGEAKWSPKIKLINNADRPFQINISVLVTGGAGNVSFEIWNDGKTEKLPTPFTLPSGSTYFYILHNFSENITPGNYTFAVDVVSV